MKIKLMTGLLFLLALPAHAAGPALTAENGPADILATFAARIPRMVRFVSEFGAAATDDDPAALDEQAHVLRMWRSTVNWPGS